MLDFLWVEGVLTVSGRAGAERLWELSERWFPDWTPRHPLTPEERDDLAVEHALRALGPATPQDVQYHFIRGSHRDLAGSLTRLTRSGAVLPVDARVNRVGRRLGYGAAGGDFRKSARSVQRAITRELPPNVESFRRAFLYLSHHGAVTCTEADPHCHVCPLLRDCPEGQKRATVGR